MITVRHLQVDRRYPHLPVRYDAPVGLLRAAAGGRQVLMFAAKAVAGDPDYLVFADLGARLCALDLWRLESIWKSAGADDNRHGDATEEER
jgi:hypothetical protein